MIKITVPGKIHLLGEHSVVYGYHALLSPINLRLTLTLTLYTPNHPNPPNHPNFLLDLKQILETEIKEKYQLKTIPNYSLSFKTDLPIGSGLGTSAALSVALSQAILQLLNITYTLDEIFNLSLKAENYFHGNSSGGDIAAVINQGFTLFKKQKTPTLPPPLQIKLPEKLNNFYLIDSGRPDESTASMVTLVSLRAKRGNLVYRNIFEQQDQLTLEMVEVLKNGAVDRLIEIIRQGERNLEEMGVVGKKAQEMIREIEEIGGAAKITGGGGIKDGSGMILSYHQNPKSMLELASKNNWKVISIKL